MHIYRSDTKNYFGATKQTLKTSTATPFFTLQAFKSKGFSTKAALPHPTFYYTGFASWANATKEQSHHITKLNEGRIFSGLHQYF